MVDNELRKHATCKWLIETSEFVRNQFNVDYPIRAAF